MLKLLISCWYDGVVVACRYMFAMGSDVVLVLLLLYTSQTCNDMLLQHHHTNTVLCLNVYYLVSVHAQTQYSRRRTNTTSEPIANM